MDHLERIHDKEEIKKWAKSLSNEDWQKYKERHRLSKKAGYRVEKITKRIDKAIEDQDKTTVEGELKFFPRETDKRNSEIFFQSLFPKITSPRGKHGPVAV